MLNYLRCYNRFTSHYDPQPTLQTLHKSMSPATEPTSTPSDLTTLLREWREGSGTAFASLIDQVYDELNRISQKRLNHIGGVISLSPTEILHEALMGIMPSTMDFKNRAHFFATMSLAMRSILVDHARARGRAKRGGGQLQVTLTGADIGEESNVADLIALDESLVALEKLDPRCGQVMHLTFFAGLTQDDIAALLNVTLRTVSRDLSFGRAWIAKGMSGDT